MSAVMGDSSTLTPPSAEPQPQPLPEIEEQIETEEITNDEDFLDHVKKVKKLLDIDVEDLKPQQATLIREELVNILGYVMKQIEGEEETKIAAQSSPQLVEVQQEQQGGRKKDKKQKGRKQKGGEEDIDMKRIGNVGGLVDESHNPSKIINSSDIAISAAVPRSFTVGEGGGYSSTSSVPPSVVSNMLPSYGTQQGGGRRKRNSKKSN